MLGQKLLLSRSCEAHRDMGCSGYIESNNTSVFQRLAKNGVGRLCMDLDRSSFNEEFLSHGESWPVEQPPGVAYIHLDPCLPGKPHYPPCILPGSFCWSVNATSSTPCCLWERSPWRAEKRRRVEEEDEAFILSLSPSLLKRKLDIGSILSGICCKWNLFDHFQSWKSTPSANIVQVVSGLMCVFEECFTVVLIFEEAHTLSAQIHSLIY